MPEDTPVGVSSVPGPPPATPAVGCPARALVAGSRSSWPGTTGTHPADVRDGTTAVDQDGMAARTGSTSTSSLSPRPAGSSSCVYQVTDPDKADAVLHDARDRPVLISEDTGETLQMAAPPHHHGSLQLGGQYFFLLANAHNAIRAGSEVTVVIDDSRLEHVEVQG